jgi:hypothetical protein
MGTRFGNADPLVHLEAGTLVVEKEHAQGG